jgi:hypothetical protein
MCVPYYVTLRSIRATIVAVGKKWASYMLSVYICSLRYPARNEHAPYCHVCPALPYNSFPHYLKNGMIFEKKKLLNTKFVFWFSLQLLSEAFLILRRNDRDMIKNVYWFSCKYPLFQSHCNDTCFFSTDFRKILNIRFHENPSNGGRVVPRGRTDRRTEERKDRRTNMTKLIVAFRNLANASKNGTTIYCYSNISVRFS